MLKKLIYVLGIIFLAIIIIINILLTANLDQSEHITIRSNNIIYAVGVILLSLALFIITKKINGKINEDVKDEDNNSIAYKRKSKIKKIALVIAIVIYLALNIIWCVLVRPPIVGDQIHACNLAQTFYNGNLEEYLPNLTYAGIPLRDYMEAYHQQISLAFVLSLFFRIIHNDGIELLRILSIIGNVFIVIAVYKIGNMFSKKYKTNKILLLTQILTFISLIMLSTFIYGDIPSIALCLFSVYFMMKYTETGKIKYPVISSVLTSIAFMMRMNSLIFIIATVIYLLLALVDGFIQRGIKGNVIKIGIICMYIGISMLPSSMVKTYYLNKYNMDDKKAYPNESYILMAMEESERGNGWYSEKIGEPALKDGENKKIEYRNRIKDRLIYLSQNMGYTLKFYTDKIVSMWAENTYQAIWNNRTEGTENLQNLVEPLTFYQKALLILTSTCSLIVLIQNRKNISLDIIFLITIFVGGFTFHILWEAKSRYIVPYIIALIPVASINIRYVKGELKDKIKEDKIEVG